MERFPIEKAAHEAELLKEKAKEIARMQDREDLTAEDYTAAEQGVEAVLENNETAEKTNDESGKENADSGKEKLELVAMKRLTRILDIFAQEINKRNANQMNELLERGALAALYGATKNLEEMIESDAVNVEGFANEFSVLSKVFSSFGPGRERAVRDDLRSLNNLSSGFKYLSDDIKKVYAELKNYSSSTGQDFSILDQSFRSFAESANRADRFIQDRRRPLERYLRS